MKQYRDTDYLHATARVRALENNMVTGRDFRKMVDAKNVEEAYKVLSDAPICQGYGISDYEAGLEHNLAQAYALVEQIAPGCGISEIFRYKYDGHNLKTAIKAKKLAGDVSGVYSTLGNLPAKQIAAQVESGRYEGLAEPIAKAAQEAVEALGKTGDPQTVDILLDKAVLGAMSQKAKETTNAFLTRFVQAQIDIANIRGTIRLRRMGKDAFFLGRILAEGGKIPPSVLVEAYTKGYDAILAVVAGSPYEKALEPSFDAIRSGKTLTLFEKICDNAMVAMLDATKTIPFGIEPLIAYLYGKESETKAARIVMASKLAGVPAQQITERLRETYA